MWWSVKNEWCVVQTWRRLISTPLLLVPICICHFLHNKILCLRKKIKILNWYSCRKDLPIKKKISAYRNMTHISKWRYTHNKTYKTRHLYNKSTMYYYTSRKSHKSRHYFGWFYHNKSLEVIDSRVVSLIWKWDSTSPDLLKSSIKIAIWNWKTLRSAICMKHGHLDHHSKLFLQVRARREDHANL
jgi:hypothetical protein